MQAKRASSLLHCTLTLSRSRLYNLLRDSRGLQRAVGRHWSTDLSPFSSSHLAPRAPVGAQCSKPASRALASYSYWCHGGEAAAVPGGGGELGAGGGAVRPAGAVLLHLRRLARGQRQQQLHRVAGARQLPALRHRLRRRPVGAFHQRAHHRRCHRSTSGLRQLHPAFRRHGRRPAPGRRQLRLRRRRHPRRDRAAAWRPHPVRGPGPELPGGGGDAGGHPGRPRHGVGPPEPVHLQHRHGQQRLPQQLLHAGLLQHRQPLHPRAVLRRAHRRLPPLPPGALQLRRPQGGHDRGRPGRVQPQRAGALQRRRRHLRRPHRRRHPDLQPPARRPRRRVQRAPRRALHLHQRVQHLQRHPRQRRVLRVHGDERGVLRGGQEQRAGDVPAVPGAVRQQGPAHLLGRLPPVGGGQHHRRTAILPRRVAQRRLPDGHQHARIPLIDRSVGDSVSTPRGGWKRPGFTFGSRAILFLYN